MYRCPYCIDTQKHNHTYACVRTHTHTHVWETRHFSLHRWGEQPSPGQVRSSGHEVTGRVAAGQPLRRRACQSLVPGCPCRGSPCRWGARRRSRGRSRSPARRWWWTRCRRPCAERPSGWSCAQTGSCTGSSVSSARPAPVPTQSKMRVNHFFHAWGTQWWRLSKRGSELRNPGQGYPPTCHLALEMVWIIHHLGKRYFSANLVVWSNGVSQLYCTGCSEKAQVTGGTAATQFSASSPVDCSPVWTDQKQRWKATVLLISVHPYFQKATPSAAVNSFTLNKP